VNKRILIIGLILGSLFTGMPLSIFYADHEGNIIPTFVSGENAIAKAYADIGVTEEHPNKEFTLIALDADIEVKPGKVERTWTFNGTMPAPPLRFTEGDNVTIHFINKTPMLHTIHFHGEHNDINDGVTPQILPGQTYTYNFIPNHAGALLYHCHALPTSLHIRMGMYGIQIVDPKDPTVLRPAREFALVYSEFDPPTQQNFEAKYYPVNGYFDQYMHGRALQVNQYELVRYYIINIGTTTPMSFHPHSTIFKVYQSGMVSNTPFDAQTFLIGTGDAAIVEARYNYPGTYLFHPHGLQEERGAMGEIDVMSSTPEDSNLTESISMIESQYEMQKELQKAVIIDYGQGAEEHVGGEILGTDTSSLLVYGVSANEFWILPTAVVSGSGAAAILVALFLRSKRS
jgi:FtsP/CotA-like multicopper oxidase with cupredoxin domain